MRDALRGGAPGEVKGFYVIEAADEPGTFWELVEFADRAGAAAFPALARQSPAWVRLEARLLSLPTRVLDDSLWDQRV
jgi:hypothetical protein